MKEERTIISMAIVISYSTVYKSSNSFPITNLIFNNCSGLIYLISFFLTLVTFIVYMHILYVVYIYTIFSIHMYHI